MRKHLLQDFDSLYHLDLRGNVRQNPKLSGTAYNVFGIQVGVGITLAIRHRASRLEGEAPAEPLSAPPPPGGRAGERGRKTGQPSHKAGPDAPSGSLQRQEAQGTPPSARSSPESRETSSEPAPRLLLHRFPLEWRRRKKLDALAALRSVAHVDWTPLQPDGKHRWLVPEGADAFARFVPIGDREAKAADDATGVLFATYCRGVITCRDDVVYGWDRDRLAARVRGFIDAYLEQLDKYKRRRAKGPVQIDDFVDVSRIKWDGTLKAHLSRLKELTFDPGRIRQANYRPFTPKFLYLDPHIINSIYLWKNFLPEQTIERENLAIWIKVGTDWPMFGFVTERIPDLLPQGGSQCFPFYTYDPDGSNRRENLTDWALDHFRAHYGPHPLPTSPEPIPAADVPTLVNPQTLRDGAPAASGLKGRRAPARGETPGTRRAAPRQSRPEGPAELVHRIIDVDESRDDRHASRPIEKWDIFHSVYAVLHHPTYRARFAEVLKKELPRIPLLPDFPRYVAAGRALAALHVHHDHAPPYDPDGAFLHWSGEPHSWRVEKMRLSRDRTTLAVNGMLTLGPIPPEVFDYRLGNRSALEWVIDQYQVDPATGEDPNRPDDPEHIVRHVQRVISVSLATVAIVNALPELPP